MQARSAEQIWEAALGELQILVNKPNYRTWLAKTTGLSYQNDRFVIGVPNTFVAEYLEQNQRSLIEKALTAVTRQEIQIQFQVHGNIPILASRRRATTIPAEQISFAQLNPKYTFDSFIMGSSNQFAHAAALKVAQNPGDNYNPLFIYGDPGVGKTHLLHAIGHMALLNEMKVLYVSAERYTNDLMLALREKKTREFRDKYRSVDMLLVDDIQFFDGKAQTEENFFHTFNELHDANHQIAVTCDRPPRALSQIKARLRSRLEGGLVTDIQPPDFETRLAILQARAEEQKVDVTADVLEFIALQIQQNIRALEGSLNRVVAYAKLVRMVLTPQLAAQALKDIATEQPITIPATPGRIMEAVVNTFHLTPSDLKGRKRDSSTALARQVAMYLIRQETDASLAAIGNHLGGRSPATVSHAYQKIAGELGSNPYLRRKIFEIQQNISTTSRQ